MEDRGDGNISVSSSVSESSSSLATASDDVVVVVYVATGGGVGCRQIGDIDVSIVKYHRILSFHVCNTALDKDS